LIGAFRLIFSKTDPPPATPLNVGYLSTVILILSIHQVASLVTRCT